ncbi:MAG: repressor LexA [bacterium]|nr:repressor LexA [bacterium]
MSTFGKLHPTQEKLLKALADLAESRPSLRVLAKEIGILSPNTIAHHLRQLEKKGYIIPSEDGQIRIDKNPVRDVIYLPLYGNAACGTEDFYADENIEERIPLPARTLRIGSDYFLVRARGDSMEPKIHNRDLLIVQQLQTPEDGQVVVAALDDGVYAKKFLRAHENILLVSFNQNYNPITVGSQQEFRLMGIVRGVLRQSLQ